MITEINGKAVIVDENTESLESLRDLREDLINLMWEITSSKREDIPAKIDALANIIFIMGPEK